MNTQEMIQRTQQLFGDTSESQITKEFILAMLNEGQRSVARNTQVLKRRSETSVSTGENSYAFSDEFLYIISVTLDGRRLERIDPVTLDQFDTTRANAGNSVPQNYYTRGRTLWLYPTPNASGSGNLDVWYVKRPDDLEDTETSVSELPDTMHMDIVLYALAKCKQLDEEFEQANTIQAELQANLIESRHEANTDNAESYGSVRLLPGDY